MNRGFWSATRPTLLRRGTGPSLVALLAVLGSGACRADRVAEGNPAVGASSSEEAGRYVAVIGGCNDCHTDHFAQLGGDVPERDWLTGSVVGFRGPWGTSYPHNLRLTVQDMTEDMWVEMARTRMALPPMPWPSLNRMSESDQRALYRYLRSLGPAGARAPAPLAPGVEPEGPWIDFDVKMVPAPRAGGDDR